MSETIKGSASLRGLSSMTGGRMSNWVRPSIMGIVNVTPDSFSDGGRHDNTNTAIAHARQLAADGADILDIGGESTRPGADAISVEEECARVVPVIEGCRDLGVTISIDSRKKAVMAAAVAAGATLINDVSALEYDPASLDFVAESGLPVCLMHSLADPKVMQENPVYENVVTDVMAYLRGRIDLCEAAGISRDRIIVDPGIGFGKTVAHNLALIRGLPEFQSFGCDILLGASRKAFIGQVTHEPEASKRVVGSVAVALHGARSGARILRVHDVKETRQALEMWQAIEAASF
ncbi:dihydropteroate synthase [Sneathiella sp. CAU 1612]|uniref:Dihydropteroate synthase n=1 Tax=Sneathiella sedimenti TaxID=2816034 RepID=A0ABS3F4V0_9PROT|nr:dihydropteroate synthase [Sneathiella sedimenti]MBO0333429.1 dihydropteroate synthase [Sneathiella sedimenti]